MEFLIIIIHITQQPVYNRFTLCEDFWWMLRYQVHIISDPISQQMRRWTDGPTKPLKDKKKKETCKRRTSLNRRICDHTKPSR